MTDKSFKPKLPNNNETAVITFNCKTAALFYDKVWCPPFYKDSLKTFEDIPEDIIFYGTEDDISQLKEHYQVDVYERVKETLTHRSKDVPVNKTTYLPELKPVVGEIFRNLAVLFADRYKITAATLYDNSELQSSSYQEGEKDVIISTIENLQIVDEEKLAWEQVLELRNDEQSKAKYKRFIHWLDKEMVGKSQSFIEDEIAIKLEDYEQTLKKHGIKTMLGTVKEIINSKSFLAGAGLGSFGFSLGNPLAAFAGGSIIVSNIAINLAEKKLAFEKCETGANSEISWVHEVKKKTKLN